PRGSRDGARRRQGTMRGANGGGERTRNGKRRLLARMGMTRTADIASIHSEGTSLAVSRSLPPPLARRSSNARRTSMRRDPDRLRARFELVIIGAGCTGAGVALDAASRGLRVALIDKGDFAGGTSCASTKLAHGGLRYLEHGEVHLVYEALHERRRLLRNAPHLVTPLRFVIPFYAGARVPAWKWRAGLLLYDALAGMGNLRRSRAVQRSRLREELPSLRGEGLTGAAEY